MVKVNKPNNYKNIIEAIKEVCGIEYGFPPNYKGIIDALALCPGGLGGVNKLLAGKGIQLNPSHGDLTLSDITISAGTSDFPFCDDCFVWCEPTGNDIGIQSELIEGETIVVKFSSDNCGACGRMSHYDKKVVEELGHEFVVATTDCDEWDKYQYLLEAVYPDPDRVGFPTYIIAQGNDPDNMAVMGSIRGALEKGKFRDRLSTAFSAEPIEQSNVVPFDTTSGGDSDSHCTDFEETGGCAPFRFDCWTSNARICKGDNYSLELRVKTHGCNNCLDGKPPGGSELSYEWYRGDSKDGPWKFVKYTSSLTVKPGKEYPAGTKVWFQARATCNDYPGGSVTIRGGGGKSDKEGGKGLEPIKVTIVNCDDPNNPPDDDSFCATKECPDGKFCCEGSESCEECCNNKQCGPGKICEKGKCVDKPECTQNKDCPGDQVCEEGICIEPPECVVDKDCPGDQICDKGVCTDPPPPDPNPDPNPDPDTDPPECSQDKDCPGDQVCKDGKCVDPPACNVDRDCPGDEICEDGVCVDPPPDCTTTGDCPGDQICEDGVCVDPPTPPTITDPCDGVTCPSGEVCQDGECVKQICIDNNCNGGWVVDWECVKTKMGL